MQHRFFALISRMRYIGRWGLMRNSFQENVQEHSHMVAVLAHGLAAVRGSFLFRLAMIGFKLLLLPLIVGIAYEINRFVGRHDNWFTRIITGPGMWFQNFTTNEPDDSMIEVGIAAVQAVLPENEGEDLW